MENEESIIGLSLETLNQLGHEMNADCIVTITDQSEENDAWLDIEVLKEGDLEEKEEEGHYVIQVYKEDKNPIEYHFKKTQTRQTLQVHRSKRSAS